MIVIEKYGRYLRDGNVNKKKEEGVKRYVLEHQMIYTTCVVVVQEGWEVCSFFVKDTMEHL